MPPNGADCALDGDNVPFTSDGDGVSGNGPSTVNVAPTVWLPQSLLNERVEPETVTIVPSPRVVVPLTGRLSTLQPPAIVQPVAAAAVNVWLPPAGVVCARVGVNVPLPTAGDGVSVYVASVVNVAPTV